MNDQLLPWLFAALTLGGLVFLLLNIFFGGDDGLDAGADDGGVGLTVIAAFVAVFGAVGLLGTFSAWSLGLTLVVAIGLAALIARVLVAALRFVARQQSTSVTRGEALIGSSARVTIETPSGGTGEAIVEGDYVAKYPVREVGGSALERGDHVDIVDVSNGILYVKKKRLS